MIHITVRLYGTLRQYRPAETTGAPHHPFTLSVPANQTIDDLRLRLGIPDGLVTAAALNDDAVEVAALLQDGDSVAMFPPSAGGS